jgi:hypothetical protein
MNDTGPLARPPRETGSREERTFERLTPAPPPCWKIRPSRAFQSSSARIESSVSRMKQAEVKGCCSRPTFNHTGVANAARWVRTSAASSASRTARSPSLGV